MAGDFDVLACPLELNKVDVSGAVAVAPDAVAKGRNSTGFETLRSRTFSMVRGFDPLPRGLRGDDGVSPESCCSLSFFASRGESGVAGDALASSCPLVFSLFDESDGGLSVKDKVDSERVDGVRGNDMGTPAS